MMSAASLMVHVLRLPNAEANAAHSSNHVVVVAGMYMRQSSSGEMERALCAGDVGRGGTQPISSRRSALLTASDFEWT